MELNYDMILSFHNVSKFVYVLKISSYSLHGAGNVLNALIMGIVGKCWLENVRMKRHRIVENSGMVASGIKMLRNVDIKHP